MSKCPHCNKLTHPEDLYVEYEPEDQELVQELSNLEGWTYRHGYRLNDPRSVDSAEFGRLKCGDIIIHFRMRDQGIEEL